MPLPLEPGQVYRFLYPRHNFHGVVSDLEPRRVRVVSLRDLHAQPLDPQTTSTQPLLRRGRWLMTGEDLDKGAERTFYVDAMQEPVPIRE